MPFLVLGPLEVRGEDDEVLPISGLKERTVLACLIAHAGRAVPVDTLIDELWGDDPPRTAEKTLGAYVSRLRRVLDARVRASIATIADGFRLDVADQAIDARLFEELVREGRHLLDVGRAPDAVKTLERAIGLWRGGAYQEFRHTNVGVGEGERLGELLRSAQEDLADARLDSGDAKATIADLETMAREEPLRERRWAQLMLALYRAGRQAEALEAFNRARSQLVEELGIEPGAELRQLQAAILAQEPLSDRPWAVAPEAPTGSTDICPYKGLARFESSDAGFYFGREQTVARAVARLVEGRFLALVGASGSGKSSLLRAGIVHSLATGAIPGSDRWTYALIRPGEHPLKRFRDAIENLDAPAPGRVIVAVDQFEEVFTACQDETERAGFMDAIADAAALEGPGTVIVAMRADYYGRCAERRAFAGLLEANQILVGPMDREELRRAIDLPAHEAGLAVEGKLADALVEATAGQPGGLPLLETSLLELWTLRQARTLTMDEYLRSGGVEGAVARLAEDAFGRLDTGAQSAAKRILLRLAVPGDGSEAVGRQASLGEFDLDRDADAERALAVLTEARLLTASDSVVEVAHEALLREWPRLRSWLEDDAQGRRLHRHLTVAARTWDEGGRDDADLYRGARLTAALEWEEDHGRDPNELERSFLAASHSASKGEATRTRRTNRRLRGLLAGVALLLALSLVVGSAALSQRDRAQAQGLIADARQLAATSLVERDDVVSLLLARQAVALHDGPETESALLAALEREPADIATTQIPGATPGDATAWLRLSPDGSILASGGARPDVTLFHTSTLESIGTVPVGHATIAGGFTPDGQTLTIATDDEHLLNIDVDAMLITDDVPSRRRITALRYSPSSSVLITGEVSQGDQGLVVARDPSTLAPLSDSTVKAGRTFITDIAFVPDGQRFVTTSSSVLGVRREDPGRTAVWRTADLRQIASYPVSGVGVVVGPDGANAFVAGRPTNDSSGTSNGFGLATLDLETRRANAVRYSNLRGDHGAALTGVASDASGAIVATDGEGKVSLWDPRSLTIDAMFSGPAGVSVRTPQTSPDGSTAYSVDINGTIVVWDLEGSRRLISPFVAGSSNGLQPSPWGPWFAVSRDGHTLAIPQVPDGRSGSVRLIDTSTLKGTHVIPYNDFGIWNPEGLAFSPNGLSLAISSYDGYVQLWNVATGKPEGPPFEVPRSAKGANFWSMPAFSPDGSLLAVAGDYCGGKVCPYVPATGGIIVIYDVATHAALQRLPLLDATVDWFAFAPDNTSLVTAIGYNQPGDIVVWNAHQGTVTRRFRVDDSGIYWADLSDDGRFFVTAGQTSARIKIWDLRTDLQVGATFVGPRLATSDGTVTSVDINPSGNMLAAAGDKVYLWDVATGTTLGTPISGDPRNGAFFSPDGRLLYVLGASGRAWVVDVDPLSWETRACRVAGRTLTEEEWSTFLPDRPYDPACMD